MKILYFSRDYTSHDHRFLSALSKTSHKVYYLRLERRGHQLEDRPLPPGIEQIAWAGGQNAASLRQAPALYFDLMRVIRLVKPDLIQAGPLQTAAFLVALTGFQPLVSMSWGYDLLVDADRNPYWRLATRFTLEHSGAMVGDCESIRQRAITFGMPADGIVTFPWGVDIHHFSPGDGTGDGSLEGTRASELNAPFFLLSTRGWEPIYGVDLIARAFVRATLRHPELRLLLLGNGSQSGLLHSIFMEGGVLEKVSFLGQVSQADLPRYYRMADLYISASHSDGTSISLLEALACGKPALISDIPGNCEWVTPGREGWLFQDGSLPALVEALLTAVDQRNKLTEMGRAARRLAEQRGNWETNFPMLMQAYELALKKAKHAS